MKLTTNSLIAVVFFFSFAPKKSLTGNNVCRNYEDYKNMANNPNCYYNPAADFSTDEVIIQNGYEVERHHVTTEDGYILGLFRIPRNGGQPVFMLHGVECSSSVFVSLGNRSLGFLLADQGYDVWLGNFRGNLYSYMHVNLTFHERKYWDHSTDEIGLYDVPAMINYISSKTGNKGNIIYLGHSLGTSAALIYGASYPEEAEKNIKLFVLVGPAYKMHHMKTVYKYFIPPLADFVRSIKQDRAVAAPQPLLSIINFICLYNPFLLRLCIIALNFFSGLQSSTTPDMVPVIFNQLPAGSSMKVDHQIGQWIFSNRFNRYNYGAKKNMKVYGTSDAPEFPVEKIKVPCYIVVSPGDWATTQEDAEILYKALSDEARYGFYSVPLKAFNHLDYFFSHKAKELVYDKVMAVMDNFK